MASPLVAHSLLPHFIPFHYRATYRCLLPVLATASYLCYRQLLRVLACALHDPLRADLEQTKRQSALHGTVHKKLISQGSTPIRRHRRTPSQSPTPWRPSWHWLTPPM